MSAATVGRPCLSCSARHACSCHVCSVAARAVICERFTSSPRFGKPRTACSATSLHLRRRAEYAPPLTFSDRLPSPNNQLTLEGDRDGRQHSTWTLCLA